MNCKQGDMAIIVRGPAQEYIGVTVRCLEFVGSPCGLTARDGRTIHTNNPETVDFWRVDGWFKYYNPDGENFEMDIVSDAYLMPITPPAQEDETTQEYIDDLITA